MAAGMGKGRLEAFSDGVLAIIITVMVLGLPTPQGTDMATLAKLAPSLLSYVLSFVYAGIYWNNHHHLFQLAKKPQVRCCGPICLCCFGCLYSP